MKKTESARSPIVPVVFVLCMVAYVMAGHVTAAEKPDKDRKASAEEGGPPPELMDESEAVTSTGEHHHGRGESKPIRPVDDSLKGDLAITDSKSDYKVPVDILNRMIQTPSLPLEKDMALMFLGFLGDRSKLDLLTAEVKDFKGDSVDLLPHISILVDAYGDTTQIPVLKKIVERKDVLPFQKLWALEILSAIGDQSKISVAKDIAKSSKFETSERLRALEMLADMGDKSLVKQAKDLSQSADIFQETRLRFLSVVHRMDPQFEVKSLLKGLESEKLSMDEKLDVAISLSETQVKETQKFLINVVDRKADTVFQQLKALYGLALLGDTSRHKVLARIIERKVKARSSAYRILVLMGDRSRMAKLEKDGREGDLEAFRTMVLAHLMDTEKVNAAGLVKKLRYRSLVKP